jgi:hypothetical protein
VIIRDTPIASEDIPVCLMVAAWHGSNRARCSFALNGAVHTAVASAEHAALGSFPEDRAVDLTEAVCPRGFCAAVDDGVVLYRDARHLTAKASRRLAPALNAALTEIGRHVGASVNAVQELIAEVATLRVPFCNPNWNQSAQSRTRCVARSR